MPVQSYRERADGVFRHSPSFRPKRARSTALFIKTVWRDGTSHFLFEPIEFLEKLAAIIPPPRGELAFVSRRPRPACSVALTGCPLRPPGPGLHRAPARGQPPRRRHPERVDLGCPDAPRGRPRRPRLSPPWRPAARHRHRPGPPRRAGHPRPPGPLRHPRAARPPTRLGRNRVDSRYRSDPGRLTLAPLHPRLDREPVAAQDGSGSEGDRGADTCLRPCNASTSGCQAGARRGSRMSPTRIAPGEAGPARKCSMSRRTVFGETRAR